MAPVGRLILEALTPQAFAPFGEVIEAVARSGTASLNDGLAERFPRLARIHCQGGEPVISIIRTRGRSLPMTIARLERHPLGTQAFVPLDGRPWISVVAAPADDLSAPRLRAFRCEGHQGLQYHAGTWHHPLIALRDGSDFLVVDRDGPGDNCEWWTLAESLLLE